MTEIVVGASGFYHFQPSLLSTDQQAEILALLEKKVPNQRCERCGHEEIGLNPNVVSPQFLGIDTRAPDGTLVHPMVMTICRHCGNTHFFSLHYLGFSWPKAA
ncbi:MAG: hypothetical protein JHD35_16160 [Sphingopyxis sp.]|nr:hypothetical protein [Sphingopyxis sp.]